MPNPYKSYSGAADSMGIAGSAAGAATAFQNPMGGVQNAQRAYHMHKHNKTLYKSQGKFLANEERAKRNKDNTASGSPMWKAMGKDDWHK